MLASKRNGTAHAHMQEGERRDDEEARLPQCQGEPEPGGGSGIMGDGIIHRTSKGLAHNLPCEDCESQEVASGEPEVALICRRDRPVVRKTKFGLGRICCQFPKEPCEKCSTHRGDSTAEGVWWQDGDENAKNDER